MSANSPAIGVPLVPSARELNRKASSSLFWQAGKLSAHLLQYVLLARLVLPAEFGKFALVYPLFMILSALNDGGLSTATVTGRQYDARLASNLWWTQLVLGVVVASIMVLGAPVISLMYGVQDLLLIGTGLAMSLLVESWGLQSKANLRRDMQVERLGLVEVGGLLMGLSVAWIASYWTRTVELLVIAHVVGAASRTAIAFLLAPLRPGRFSPSPEYRRALRTGWHVVGGDLLNIMRNQSPTIAIGFFITLTQVGLFNRANQLFSIPLTMLAPAIANFLLPLLSRTRETPQQFQLHVVSTQRLFLAVAIPISVWIALGPTHLVVFALGAEWAPAVTILQCLSPLFMSQVLATVARMTLLASDQAHVDRKFSFLNLLLTVLVVFSAAPFGVYAVALALSISGLLLRSPLLAWFAIRNRSMALASVLDGLATIALLAVPAALLVLACRWARGPGVLSDLLGLGAVAGVSAIALVLIVRRQRHGGAE